jgi:PAS domain S-box-containing protein
VRWEIHPWYESAEQIGGIILFSELITDRKEAQAALRESQARLTGMIESAMDAIISIDNEQRVVLFNTAAEKMFGCTASEALGQPLVNFMPERFRKTHPEHVRAFGQTDVTNRAMGLTHVIAGQRMNGEEFPIEAALSQVEVAGSKLYTAILRDVTERKHAEERLRESETRYRTLIENSHDLIQSVAPDGRLIFVNRAWLQALDYTDADLPGLRVWDIIAADEQTHCRAVFARVLAGNEIDHVQTTFVGKNGRRVDVEGSVTARRAGDQVVATQSYFRDITERKRVRERLRYQADLLQNVSDAIIASDLEFKITTWNRAAENIYGWMAIEVIGKPTDQILQTDHMHAQPEEVRQQLRERGLWKGEVIQKHRDGSKVYILASVSLIKDSDGQTVGFVAVNRDITAHKQAEEAQANLENQLRQSQKMESIGRLAGGVAHDFNNLITVIQMYSDVVKAQMSAEDPLLKKIQQIRLASERAATLTRQLLAFSRKQILAPVVLDLNELVENLHLMLERLIGEDIKLTTTLQPGLWSITADPGQIEQVIMNLVVNARDAMPTGGMLTIETRNARLDESYAGAHVEAPIGPCVMLAVTDTGHGMDERTRTQIFEPFFTTKPAGVGTGLGLSTVHGIVKQSGGSILVYSEPGNGTTFKIYLPAGETVSENPLASQTQSVAQRGDETILLVEDEEAVRELVRIALQDKGYTVIEAHDADEAISLCKDYPGQIDLLLTDVVMPLRSGRELAEQLKALRPQTKVLFMSGYTDDAVVRHGVLAAEVAFLPKPFSANALVSKVRDVLDK